MKKIMTVVLCSLVTLGASAQKTNVEAAKKLAGKTDKIEEARSLIKQALENPETAGLADTYYIAGKIEWDAYDKNELNRAMNVGEVDPLEMADQLINGYKYFVQVFPLDTFTNKKGEPKPKYTKELKGKISGKFDDFYTAGANYLSNPTLYPKAYEAFMIYGDMPDMEIMADRKLEVKDPQRSRANAYYYAGRAAYSAEQMDNAIGAFEKARKNGYESESPNEDPALYEIATWQYIQQNDSTRVKEGNEKILDIARAGYQKYGISQPFYVNNVVNSLIQTDKNQEAINFINDAIASNPEESTLLSLRGFINDRMGNEEAAEADYRMAADMPNADHDTYINAISVLYRLGRQKMNDVELGDPDYHNKRKAIKDNYFQVAKKYAQADIDLQNQIISKNEQEAQAEGADKRFLEAGINNAKNNIATIEGVIEDIDYQLNL